jgi:dynein heavy chain
VPATKRLRFLIILAAEPIIAEAEAALNSLDKGSLGELKSFGSPAAEIVQVSCVQCSAVTALWCSPQLQDLAESLCMLAVLS